MNSTNNCPQKMNWKIVRKIIPAPAVDKDSGLVGVTVNPGVCLIVQVIDASDASQQQIERGWLAIRIDDHSPGTGEQFRLTAGQPLRLAFVKMRIPPFQIDSPHEFVFGHQLHDGYRYLRKRLDLLGIHSAAFDLQ